MEKNVVYLSKLEPESTINDPVYIATNSPAGYFLCDIDGEYMFCHGWQYAEIFERETAAEFIYRNQLRSSFLVPAGEVC